ncbi:TRAP transporter large permease [Nitratireductor rhodophyticola]|uniref:TRAP transporter large permease protein n=2 Tax=Nitratireductor TaxID=245876 RepID=A0A1H4LXT2_9HYPH|nr:MULTISPECIES: TRAP transporter large permease [Nitratireductor]MBY8916999.1 TRAP transporter large permease [Nitratireductor rhodophyticola]MEC9243975.1 TRAP transporter large permease [Pseudomonadota bacterium]MBY8920572.1 TRAP transporter large permease [Nitratireductor rhodophyticola]WPZ14745.1 TRAP transporter large permease [Nitratireductor rhodophyticola]SEB75367.1 TRAP transporter, DctM subunit [Nitratireductor aquibiodomus]
MLTISIIGLLLVLLFMGLPLVFAIGASSMVYFFFADINLALLTQRMTASINSFLILAIPFFFLAGELMNACKLTDRIIALAKALVGHIHGGLAQVNIFASLIFSGMSGSPTADTTALGSVLIPAMKKEGYPAPFSAAVTVASSMVGPMIPPSVALVIYGTLANVSIGRLLLAGILPGFVIIGTQMLFTYFYARKRDFPRYERATLPELATAIKGGGPAILFPVIIVAGILFGIFSPTEAAAVAVLYGLLLSLFYRNVKGADIWGAIQNTALGTARILSIIAVASAFSWIMVREQVPLAIADGISTISENPVIALFVIVAMLLGVGLLMVASSAEIVLTPILVPVILQFGIDPVHFGVLMVFSLIIGGATPPVGVLMFIAQDIAKISHGQMVKAMLPFYIPLFTAVVLLVLFPQISLFLPNLVFGN